MTCAPRHPSKSRSAGTCTTRDGSSLEVGSGAIFRSQAAEAPCRSLTFFPLAASVALGFFVVLTMARHSGSRPPRCRRADDGGLSGRSRGRLMGGLEHCSATAGAVGDRGPAALCQLRAEPGDAAGADPVRLWPLPVGMLAAGVAMRPTASSRRSPWHAPRSSATRLGSYAGTVIFWPSRTRPRPPKLWRQHPPPRFPPSTRNWPPSARLPLSLK